MVVKHKVPNTNNLALPKKNPGPSKNGPLEKTTDASTRTPASCGTPTAIYLYVTKCTQVTQIPWRVNKRTMYPMKVDAFYL
ncbi:hypothetical protein AMELA_G00121790 [Ameiurus melas]|uniref:Uncharacterized protein n=1 Tax=Ameiurus melas TaxID=219545 RepID=A0A7J6ALT0_AMEME|nr:hypothetical protein AMELA_G00121790 [Ameiurus melas]